LFLLKTGMLKDERKELGSDGDLPKVADFERRLQDKKMLKLFRKRVVCATQAGTKFEENCSSKLFGKFVTKSDEAFCYLVVKNNEDFLDAVAADVMVELLTNKEKEKYHVKWTKGKGMNIKDGGEFFVTCHAMGFVIGLLAVCHIHILPFHLCRVG